jgi:hypothetical protein
MKETRKNYLLLAKVFLLLVGFVQGLLASMHHFQQLKIIDVIILVPLIILIGPILCVLLFRVEVAIGAFKPPWEKPSLIGELNPLSCVQLGSFLLYAIGVGAMISMAWSGLTAFEYMLLGFSGGIAFHLALLLLMKRYPPLQMNAANDTKEQVKGET